MNASSAPDFSLFALISRERNLFSEAEHSLFYGENLEKHRILHKFSWGLFGGKRAVKIAFYGQDGQIYTPEYLQYL
jgi:hypothetical protein